MKSSCNLVAACLWQNTRTDSLLQNVRIFFWKWTNLSQLLRVQTRGLNQLWCITRDIYQSLDHGLEKKGVFLDISKIFDKVWHEHLLFTLKQNGIPGNLLDVITDFLYQRKQRAVLNGQHPFWTNIEAEVSQGSLLGPLFFLIYISDLSDGLTSNP